MFAVADEVYINLHPLRAIWDNPVTARPRMEPNFAAACHGLELAFVLLAEFIQDSRQYLAKRPRIELVCRDVEAQCQLLAQLMDGELEDTRIDEADDAADAPAHSSDDSDEEEENPGYPEHSPGMVTKYCGSASV